MVISMLHSGLSGFIVCTLIVSVLGALIEGSSDVTIMFAAVPLAGVVALRDTALDWD